VVPKHRNIHAGAVAGHRSRRRRGVQAGTINKVPGDGAHRRRLAAVWGTCMVIMPEAEGAGVARCRVHGVGVPDGRTVAEGVHLLQNARVCRWQSECWWKECKY
jgi:hypothetical protein